MDTLPPPLDLTAPYDMSNLANKTVIVTGGASGIGAGISRRWADLGANIIILDVLDTAGAELVAELRLKQLAKSPACESKPGEERRKDKHHFIHADVTSFPSLASAFRVAATELSPTGHINIVLANAGIGETPSAPGGLTVPASPSSLLTAGLAGCDPPPNPDLRVLETNLIGVAYTIQLALFWLERNMDKPIGSSFPEGDYGGKGEGRAGKLDRSLILFGSMLSIIACPALPQYSAAKHGVLGFFRSLRATPSVWLGKGIRLNMLLPYFIDTPIVRPSARILVAGGGMAQVDEVVEAATRLAADESVCGRVLAVGPRVRVKGGEDEMSVVELADGEEVKENVRSFWEVYVNDYEMTEVFIRRLVGLLNTVETIRGWAGWTVDMLKAFLMIFKWTLLRRRY